MVIVIIINGKNHGLGYPYVRKPPFNHSSERPEIWPEGHPVIPFPLPSDAAVDGSAGAGTLDSRMSAAFVGTFLHSWVATTYTARSA